MAHARDSSRSAGSPGKPGSLFVWLALIVGATLVLSIALSAFQERPRRRSQCKNNLKQIGLALHNYHDIFGCLPPAYFADENGKPIHSWRVMVLPQLEQAALFQQYRFDEPWDGPNNRQLHDRIVEVYRCPQDEGEAKATAASYVALVGPETAWPGSEVRSFSEIRDGLSNTLLVVEIANSGIHWMEPRELEVGAAGLAINPKAGPGAASRHKEGVNAVLGDGAVRFLSNTVAPETLRALLTRDGGEHVGEF